MAPNHRLMAVVLVGVALAGCLGATSGGELEEAPPAQSREIPAIPDYDFASALTDLHPHEVAELHTAHENLELADHTLATDGLAPWATGSGFSEAHVRDGYAIVSSVEGQRGFSIFDVGDGSIETLGHVYSGAETWDTRFSDGGDWAFMGCQGGGRYGAYLTDNAIGGCTSGARPQAPVEPDYESSGIVAVNVSDPSEPTVAAYTPSSAVHNLHTATIDGTIYVANHKIEIFAFHPESRHFEKVSEIPGTHDLAIQKHPVTGGWLLYTGNSTGGDGMAIWDVDDPADPVPVSTIHEGEDGTRVVGWHEQTPAPALIDGRHLTVTAGEQFGGQPGPVSVIDTTDPAHPVLLGQWKLPGEYTDQQSYKFSSHNVDVSPTGQVAIGMYHGGVWVFDVSTADRMADPPTLAFYQPHEVAPEGGQQPSPYGVFTGAPYVWGAQWTDDGSLLTPDMNTGVYLLEPTWETVEAGS